MDHGFTGRAQANVGRAPQAPRTFDGNKHTGVQGDIDSLLFGCKLHHAPSCFRIAKGCEDLPAHSEIGMAHVTFFLRAGQAACDSPKIVSVYHSVASLEVSPDRIALRGAR